MEHLRHLLLDLPDPLLGLQSLVFLGDQVLPGDDNHPFQLNHFLLARRNRTVFVFELLEDGVELALFYRDEFIHQLRIRFLFRIDHFFKLDVKIEEV